MLTNENTQTFRIQRCGWILEFVYIKEVIEAMNMTESDLQILNALRPRLLHLHKLLVDYERRNYERHHGKVSNNEFLQLLIGDDRLKWMRFFSEMIVEIDELLESKEPVDPEEVASILSNARKLLNPSLISDEFDNHYREALQNDPDIVMAHQAVRESLK